MRIELWVLESSLSAMAPPIPHMKGLIIANVFIYSRLNFTNYTKYVRSKRLWVAWILATVKITSHSCNEKIVNELHLRSGLPQILLAGSLVISNINNHKVNCQTSCHLTKFRVFCHFNSVKRTVKLHLISLVYICQVRWVVQR